MSPNPNRHVFDQYHSLWFPLWCFFGLTLALAGEGFPLPRIAVVSGVWGMVTAGTWLSFPRKQSLRMIAQGTIGYGFILSAPFVGRLTDSSAGPASGLSGMLTEWLPSAVPAAGVGILLLMVIPDRQSGQPETGPASTEWMSASLLALASAGTETSRAAAMLAGIRFTAGILYRFVPVRRSANRDLNILNDLTWLPVAILLTGMSRETIVVIALAGRLAFHITDGVSRLKALGDLVPGGFRAGLFRSFLIYYRVPFRRRRMKKFYSAFLKSGDRAWDVGSHLGNRSRIWLNLGLIVTAFEPQPACAAVLENWFGECRGFSLVPKAVGSTAGKRTLRLSGGSPTLASVSGEWVERMAAHPLFRKVRWESDIEIEQTTLAAVSGDEPLADFIKIDVEGSESAVIDGMDGVPGALSFEFLPADRGNSLKALETLDSRGNWEWNIAIKEQFRFLFPTNISSSRLRSWLAERPDSDPSGDIYGWHIHD